MNQNAVMTSVKSLQDVECLLHSLREGDVGKLETLNHLRSIEAELKRLLGRDPAEAKAQMLSALSAFSAELKSSRQRDAAKSVGLPWGLEIRSRERGRRDAWLDKLAAMRSHALDLLPRP
jgi:hypothetical protein